MMRRWVACFGVIVFLACGLGQAAGRTVAWSSPASLVADAQTSGYEVGIADGGEAVATWAGGHGVWAAAAPPGLPFGRPQRISAHPLDGNNDQLLSVDRHGDAAIVWVQGYRPNHSAGDLFLSYRGAGGPFLPGHRIVRGVGAVAMAMDAAGDLTIVLQTVRNDGRGSGIAVLRRGANGRLGRSQQLFRGSDAAGPAVAVDRRDDAVAVWQSGPVSASSIECATRVAGQRFTRAFEIVTAGVGGFAPNVGIDDHGTALVAWDGAFDGAASGIPFRHVQTGVVHTGRLGVTQVRGLRETERGGLLEIDPQPQVSVDRRGDAAVVWEQEARRPGGLDTIEIARGRVGAALPTRTIGGGHLDEPPQAAISQSGAVIVAWDDLLGPTRAILARGSTSGFGSSERLSSSNRLSAGPVVAISRTRAIALWQDLGPAAGTPGGPQDTALLYRVSNLT